MFKNSDVYRFTIAVAHVGGDVWVGEYVTEDGKVLYYSYDKDDEFVTKQSADHLDEADTVAECMKLLKALVI
jgi:hypothetical protein